MAEPGDPVAPTPRRSWAARAAALLALLAALAAIGLIISGSLGDDDPIEPAGKADKTERGADSGTEEPTEEEPEEEIQETYEVQSGDSLSTIGDEFGISIEKLERLNPDVDPQALATGQTLKLR